MIYIHISYVCFALDLHKIYLAMIEKLVYTSSLVISLSHSLSRYYNDYAY